MILVICVPAPGHDVYRCGWREEERDGRIVRVGLCWSAGVTELPDGALTREQIDMLKRDPGKRITVKELPDPVPSAPEIDPGTQSLEPTPLEAASVKSASVEPTPLEPASVEAAAAELAPLEAASVEGSAVEPAPFDAAAVIGDRALALVEVTRADRDGGREIEPRARGPPREDT